MFEKRFFVKISLQLHAITCPGVWLCTRGYLEATVKTLGYFFRTGAMEPRFPLLCHDQFTMEGYFKSIGSMEELEQVLGAEQVEITLWQNGRRLAHFIGKWEDVMQMSGTPKLSCEHNVNVQLLMKVTSAFPGIIAPKVELSTHIGMKDRSPRETSSTYSDCGTYCQNSKFITPKFELEMNTKKTNRHRHEEGKGGNCFKFLEEKRRQQTVCHTRSSKCGSPRCCSSRCNHVLGRSQSSVAFEPSLSSHTNEQGIHSNGSSHISSISTNLSQITRSSSSECDHSPPIKNYKGAIPQDHQRSCVICQKYKRVFM